VELLDGCAWQIGSSIQRCACEGQYLRSCQDESRDFHSGGIVRLKNVGAEKLKHPLNVDVLLVVSIDAEEVRSSSWVCLCMFDLFSLSLSFLHTPPTLIHEFSLTELDDSLIIYLG
jgi:hypothetical protein